MAEQQSKSNVKNGVIKLEQSPKKSWSKNTIVYGSFFLAISLVIFSSIRFHRDSDQYHNFLHGRTSDAPIIQPIVNKSISNIQEEIRSQLENVTVKKFQSIPALPSDKNESVSSRGSSCLQWNSKAWLEGSRLGNSQDSFVTDQLAIDTILGTTPTTFDEKDLIPTVLQQSLCDENSRFLQFTADEGVDEKNIEAWTMRLMYLAFHLNQHRPAVKEAIARSSLPEQCREELNKHKVGRFDFECPDRKFLVVTMGKLGLGAVMRLGAVNALLAGVATNRTVVSFALALA